MDSSKIRSLIIDDDPFIMNLLEDMIESDFPELEIVGTANSGQAGIDLINQARPELIFLDVEMSDMTGFDLLQHFEQPFFQTIFITSYDHYALKALRMHALDYLLKPIDPQELRQAVNQYKEKAENIARNETIKHTLNSLEKLVLNILPAEVAREIQTYGSSKTKRYELVTVLFADIKSFTQHAASLSAEKLVEELNLYYSAFDLILENYSVEKIKTIGDAYMAAGGVPVANTSNPGDTVKAALAIRDFVVAMARQRTRNGQKPFEFRIGLHSGPVVAGIVGIRKFAYDIWGDTVNIAARIEEKGRSGKVNISQATFEQIGDDPEFAFEARGEIQAKGTGGLEMYFVEQA